MLLQSSLFALQRQWERIIGLLAGLKSSADFIAKMKVVEEEADEALYWMELLQESGFIAEENLAGLMKEGNELLAMTVASIKTARNNK